MENGVRFLKGFVTGAAGALAAGLAALFVFAESGLLVVPADGLDIPLGWADWLFHNLGWSIPVFALLLGAFAATTGLPVAIASIVTMLCNSAVPALQNTSVAA